MKRTKIAPTLAELLDTRTDPYWNAARDEFRALLAVARAATRSVNAVFRGGDGSWTWDMVSPGDPDGDTARALARLRRLSAPRVSPGPSTVKATRKLTSNSARARPGARRTRT